MRHERIFWCGVHPTLGGSCLGKLHREGLAVLRAHGWRQVAADHTASLPAFCWATRRACDFDALSSELPLIRQLPQAASTAVDDKVLLAEHLAHAGYLRCRWLPEQYTDVTQLCARLEAESESAATADADAKLWFVKHRHGVKGQGIRLLRGSAALIHAVKKMDMRAQFVVQAEVPPLLLSDGRKFGLRSHVLVYCHGGETGKPHPPRAWLHHDVIVLPHSAVYDCLSDAKPVWRRSAIPYRSITPSSSCPSPPHRTTTLSRSTAPSSRSATHVRCISVRLVVPTRRRLCFRQTSQYIRLRLQLVPMLPASLPTPHIALPLIPPTPVPPPPMPPTPPPLMALSAPAPSPQPPAPSLPAPAPSPPPPAPPPPLLPPTLER